MQFKQYPSYKNSGVEWLGGVPEHWDVKRLKYLFSIKNGATPKSNVSQFWDGDIKWVTPSDLSKLESHEIAESSRTITVEGFNSCGTNLVPAGSIIVSCRAPIGSLAITLTSLCTNQGCKSLVASKILNIKFYFYFLSISADKLNSLGNGTTFLELSSFELKNLSILAPRLEEQTQIVSFLDSETSRIDNLIAKQEKLIEKLEEHRKSVISHAVTKGLDPNVPMKDSGSEWLGEVPRHWILKPIKFLSKINQSTLAETTDENLDIQYVDIGSVSATYGIEKIEQYVFSQAPSRARRIVADKDIIVSTVRTYLKAITYIENPPKNLIVSTGFAVLTPIKRVIKPQFAKYAFLAEQFIAEVISKSKGISYPAITASELAAIKIALPPLSEQVRIIENLDAKCQKINTLIVKQKNLIEKLKSYRTSIISHAVTGKIDVCDLVA